MDLHACGSTGLWACVSVYASMRLSVCASMCLSMCACYCPLLLPPCVGCRCGSRLTGCARCRPPPARPDDPPSLQHTVLPTHGNLHRMHAHGCAHGCAEASGGWWKVREVRSTLDYAVPPPVLRPARTYASMCLSVYASMCLSVYVSMYLSVYASYLPFVLPSCVEDVAKPTLRTLEGAEAKFR